MSKQLKNIIYIYIYPNISPIVQNLQEEKISRLENSRILKYVKNI